MHRVNMALSSSFKKAMPVTGLGVHIGIDSCLFASKGVAGNACSILGQEGVQLRHLNASMPTHNQDRLFGTAGK